MLVGSVDRLDIVTGTRKMISSVNPNASGQSEVVINENSVDTDFRVETDEGITPMHAIFVRASDGKIGIHESSPSYNLDISGSIRFQDALYDNTASSGSSGQVLSSVSGGTRWVAATSGPTGPTGASGSKGEPGAQGPAGSGAQGPSGATAPLPSGQIAVGSASNVISGSSFIQSTAITGGERVNLIGTLVVGSSAALTTVGAINATNDVVAYYSSDKRLKENIIPIDNPIEKLLQISGVEFDWKPLTEEEKRFIHPHDGHDIGVIAQEIEEVLPDVVETRENGYKAVRETGE